MNLDIYDQLYCQDDVATYQGRQSIVNGGEGHKLCVEIERDVNPKLNEGNTHILQFDLNILAKCAPQNVQWL